MIKEFKKSVKIGIVQTGAVYMDLGKTMTKAETLIEEAVADGAELVVFGETWLSGYPAWLDHCPEMAFWNNEPTKEVFARMYRNSICVPGDETRQLGEIALKHKIYICIGVNEIVESGPGSGTIYNSLLVIGSNGGVLNHHRKLMPTYTEKLVYGAGDGHGLNAVETPFGRLGGLICWEHWMPLTRHAMHSVNEHIHVAVWPTLHETHQLASRHYAFEGRCFVVAVGQMMRARDFPPELILPKQFEEQPDKFILSGGSCVVAPDGSYVLEPQFEKEGVFVVTINDLDRVVKERMTLDTTGHYNRADVFDFKVNKERKC